MKKLSLIVLLISVMACGKNSEPAKRTSTTTENEYEVVEEASLEDVEIASLKEENTVEPEISSTQRESGFFEPKLIKRASLIYKNDSLEPFHLYVLQLTRKYQAYIAKDEIELNDYRKSYRMQIRIPVQYFESFIKDLKKHVTNPEYFHINTNDVSEEYFDLQARLKNYKRLKERYLDLYKKAKNIREILEIEKHVNKIQMDIDRIEGKLKFLKDKTTYSTVEIEAYKNIKEVKKQKQPNPYWNALKNSWALITGIVIWVLQIWPLILIGAGLWYVLRKKIKKTTPKK